MQLRSELNQQDYQNIKRVYLSAFPKEERPPFFILRRSAEQKKGMFLVIEEEEQFIGFQHIVVHADLVYLAFFAVDDACRGKGYGSQSLQLLQKKYADKKILIARESLDPNTANYAQRVRRYGFYQRNGFHDIPCSIQEGGVVYDAMSANGDVRPEEYEALVKTWNGPLVRKLIGFSMYEK